MENSRTNAQYKRNDRYNFLYEIEWILSVCPMIFFRTTDTTDAGCHENSDPENSDPENSDPLKFKLFSILIT